LDEGGEQGGREWIPTMSMDDARSKPEPNPEAHYQVRNQNEKGSFPIQKEYACEQERPKDPPRDDGHREGHHARMGLPDHHFIEQKQRQPGCGNNWKPPPPTVRQRHVEYGGRGNQAKTDDESSCGSCPRKINQPRP
jgi:hypothetical protein